MPFGYLALASVIAVSIYGFSEVPIGPGHFILTAIALALAAVSLLYPALGIVFVIAAVLIMPPSTRIPGLGPLSPNLLFSACTVLGFLVRLVRDRRSLAWSRYYFALVPMLIWHAASALFGYGPQSLFFLQTFVQGTLPFTISSTAQRTRPMLILGLIGLVTAYTARSLYLLVVEGVPVVLESLPALQRWAGPSALRTHALWRPRDGAGMGRESHGRSYVRSLRLCAWLAKSLFLLHYIRRRHAYRLDESRAWRNDWIDDRCPCGRNNGDTGSPVGTHGHWRKCGGDHRSIRVLVFAIAAAPHGDDGYRSWRRR